MSHSITGVVGPYYPQVLSRTRGIVRLIPLVSALACGSPSTGPRHLTMRAGPSISLARDTSSASPERLDSLLLFQPWGVRSVGDALYVSDSGNDRVRILDATLAAVQTFGRKGAGPGELEYPQALDVNGSLVAVLDARHLRVNRYLDDGTYVGEFRLPGAVRSFAILNSDHIVIPDPTGQRAFVVIGADGSEVPLGELTTDSTGLGDLYPGLREQVGGRWNQVAVANGSVIVADDFSGALDVYSEDGRLLSALSLPLAVRESIFKYLRKVDSSFGAPSVGSPIYKDMTTLPNGHVLVLTGVPGNDLIEVDPLAATYQLITAPDGPTGDDLRHAASVTVMGPLTVAAGMNGLSLFHVAGD